MNKPKNFSFRIGSKLTLIAVLCAMSLFVDCDCDNNPSGGGSLGNASLILGPNQAWVDELTERSGFIFKSGGKVEIIMSTDGTNWIAVTGDYTRAGSSLTIDGVKYIHNVTSTTLTLTVEGSPPGTPGMVYKKKDGVTLPNDPGDNNNGPCGGLTSAAPESACCIEQPTFTGCFVGGAGGLLLPLGEAWVERSMGVTGFVFRDNGMVWVITSANGTNWTAAAPVTYAQSGSSLTIAPITYTFDVTGSILTFTVEGSSISQTYEKRTGMLIDGIPPYVLTVNISPAGSGTVNRTPASSGYAAGVVVTLEAVPAGNYIFDGWSGAGTGATAARTVTMSSHQTVTAAFRQLTASDYNYGSYCDFGPVAGDEGGCIQIVQGSWQGLPCAMQGGIVRSSISGCSPGSLKLFCDYGFGDCQEILISSECGIDGVVTTECGSSAGTYCNFGQPDQHGSGGCFFRPYSVPSGGYSWVDTGPGYSNPYSGMCANSGDDRWARVVTQQACITSNTTNVCILNPLKPGEWGGTGHAQCPTPPVPDATLACAPGEVWTYNDMTYGYILLAGGTLQLAERISGSNWSIIGAGTWQSSSGLITINAPAQTITGIYYISGNSMNIQALGTSAVYPFTKVTGVNLM